MTDISTSTGTADINGTQFAYEVSGSGHPLVLVHAGIADQHMWDNQVPAFAQHYQVIRYDLRGYGKTPIASGKFSYSHELYNLLGFLDIENAYLLGCSAGGATIIDLALEHPRVADALILVTSAVNGYEYEFEDEPPEDWKEHQAAVERGDLARAAALEADYWIAGPHRTADQVDPAIRQYMYEANAIALANKVSEPDNEQVLEPVAAHRLAEIHVPSLVIVGDLDDLNIVKCGELLAASIAGAKKIVMAGTAHFPSMERPDEFNRIVLDFLAGLP